MGAGKTMIFFGLIWSAMTLLFDGFVVVPTVRQMAAMRYPTTEGTVLAAEVTQHDGEDGYTYGVAMTYSYRVNGREYEGRRYRYQSGSSSDCGWAHAAVARHPAGSKTAVYYNPLHPEDAVLSPGVNGGDLFLVLFMTPFNAVMVGFWAMGLGRLRRRWFKPLAGGVRIISHLRVTRVRMNALSPVATALAAMALTAFLSLFPIAFLGGGFHPSMRTVLAAWSVVFAVGLGAWGWQWRQLLAGKHDLVLNELEGQLELPLTCGRKSHTTIPLARIQAAFVETIEKTSSDGDKSSPMFAPTVRLDDGSKEKLAEWFDADRAAAFVAWFNGKLPVRKPSPVGSQWLTKPV